MCRCRRRAYLVTNYEVTSRLSVSTGSCHTTTIRSFAVPMPVAEILPSLPRCESAGSSRQNGGHPPPPLSRQQITDCSHVLIHHNYEMSPDTRQHRRWLGTVRPVGGARAAEEETEAGGQGWCGPQIFLGPVSSVHCVALSRPSFVLRWCRDRCTVLRAVSNRVPSRPPPLSCDAFPSRPCPMFDEEAGGGGGGGGSLDGFDKVGLAGVVREDVGDTCICTSCGSSLPSPL